MNFEGWVKGRFVGCSGDRVEVGLLVFLLEYFKIILSEFDRLFIAFLSYITDYKNTVTLLFFI